MKVNVFVLPPADRELEEAVDYYNDQMTGLGQQFYNSFLDTIGYLQHTPNA